MLLTDVVRQVQRRFGDQIGSVITQQDVFDWVNEACIEIVKETKINSIELPFTIATYLAGPNFIELSSNHIVVEYVKFDDWFLEIKDYRLLESKLDRTGTPLYYYLDYLGQDVDDPGVLRKTHLKLFPNPDSGLSTSNLAVGLRSLPTPITALADPIDLPPQFHNDVMNFCLMRAHERNKDWQGMNVAAQNFNQGLVKRSEPSGDVEDSWPVMEDVIGYN